MHTTRPLCLVFVLGFVAAVAMGGCGSARPDEAALGTKIAANIFATQTAQVPSPTPTAPPTNTPLPLPTPTGPPEPTATPTPSPAPTNTPVPTATEPPPTAPTTLLAQKTPSATARRATYNDPEGFFSLTYPKSWTPHRSRSEMQFWADEEGNAALAISLQIKALSAESLVKEISDFLAGAWEDYEELSQRETTLSGYPAVWLEQSFRVKGDPYRGLLAGAVRNRVGYLLLAWAPEKGYPALEPEFRAIVESLRIADFDEAPVYEEWLTYDSEHFTFYFLPDTYVADDIETIADDHEQVFNENVKALGVDYDGVITMYLYPSKESLYRATAREAGFAITEASEVHAWWISAREHQSLGHEMTHVITYQALGDASEALLGEGIAVCLDHSGNEHHATAAELLKDDRLVPLSEMLGDAWFDQDAEVAYPESGSFACFLLDESGGDRFKKISTKSHFEAALTES
ncbi:MAG: hypothetical protein IT330_06255 [Anaerolineae bacterium]|nr:hypothetical protein [Anaerolineae bacterium]